MLSLFKIEWLKIKTYRTFWVLFLAFIIFFPVAFYYSASNYMESHTGAGNMEENMIKSLLGSPFIFPKVWHGAAWMGGLFFILIGMLFILLITNEVQYRTHRQNIIDGWSRMDFLKAKLSLLIFFVLVSTLLVFVTGLVVGLIFSPARDNMFEEFYFIGYFAMMAALYLAFAYLAAILIKRTGLAIIIYFAAVCIVDNVLWLSLTFKGSQIGYFLPFESADSLVTNPFKPKMLEKRTVEDYYLLTAAITYCVIVTAVIINYFKKTDLKT